MKGWPILVVNAGSSSVKFALYGYVPGEGRTALFRGQVKEIGNAPCLVARDGEGRLLVERALDSQQIRDPHSAMEEASAWLAGFLHGESLAAVGHRVVHGGLKYSQPVVVDRAVFSELKQFIPLAPLHQPFNLAAIESMFERWPGVPQVACFDTGFHRGWPLVAQTVALPWQYFESGVRRYGFHGLSYEYVATRLSEVAPEIAAGRVVVAHLGSGASLCALRSGEAVDSTLGYTGLDGLCMGTRAGSLDPGIVLHLFQSRGLSVPEVETILYKQSGLLGISGITSDMKGLLENSKPRARLAVDFFVYRAVREIGALAAVLGGLDALVFTGGIGENAPAIRARICSGSSWLGLNLDEEANRRGEARISESASRVSVWVIPTNEELMIARHTARTLDLDP